MTHEVTVTVQEEREKGHVAIYDEDHEVDNLDDAIDMLIKAYGTEELHEDDRWIEIGHPKYS